MNATADKSKLELKPISQSGIKQALAKVTHYRYLNQAEEAESICRDVLAVDAGDQAAVRLLGLVLTDQFTGGAKDRYTEALATFAGLTDAYERTYYTGIAHERHAKAQHQLGHHGRSLLASFHEAMECFAKAEKLRPAGNDDAILRWNRCARIVQTLGHEREDEAGFDVSDSAPV